MWDHVRMWDHVIILGGHSLGRGVHIRPKVDEWRRLLGADTHVTSLDTSVVRVRSKENKLIQQYQLKWGEWVGTLPLVVLGPFQLNSWGWLRDLHPQAVEETVSAHTRPPRQRLTHQMSGTQPTIALTHSPPTWSNVHMHGHLHSPRVELSHNQAPKTKTWKWFQGCLGDHLSVDYNTLICTHCSSGRQRLLCDGGQNHHLCGGAHAHHSLKIRGCDRILCLNSGGLLPLLWLDVMPID